MPTEDDWDPRYAQPPLAQPTVYRPSEHRRYTSQPENYYSSRRALASSSYSSRYYKNHRRDEELRGRSPSLPPPSRRAHRELKHRRRSSSLSPPSRRAHREPEPAHDDNYSDSFDSNSLLVDQRMADELELTDDQSMDTRDDFDLHERHDNTGRRSTTFENKTEALKIWVCKCFFARV